MGYTRGMGYRQYIFASLWVLLLAFFTGCSSVVESSSTVKTKEGTTPLYRLSNDKLTVEVLPELGGKVIAIKDCDGFNYLSRSNKPYIERSDTMTYLDTEFDGIDECFMSIEPSIYPTGSRKGVSVKDHGPLPYMKWQRLDDDGLSFFADMTTWSASFQRQIQLDANRVSFSYSLTNYGKEELFFIYAFHPLFSADTGTNIHWSDELKIQASYSTNNFLKKQGDELIWGDIKGVDEKSLFKEAQFKANSNQYYKYFTKDPGIRSVDLTHANQKGLTIEWDNTFTPFVAVWCSQGSVGGLHHIAIEPTNARFDSLAKAYGHKKSTAILPGQTLQWTISILIHEQ